MGAVATSDNDAQLVIERTKTGRRGPLAVAVLAVVMVGVLLWKPWDRPSPAPSLGPFAAVPSPTPTPSPSPTPSASPTPTPTSVRVIFPTATPSSSPSPMPAVVEVVVGTDRGRPFVECAYQLVGDGGSVLEQVRVRPPIVQVNLDADTLNVRRVAWRAAVQLNRLETLFSADWEPVGESRRQFAGDLTTEPLTLSRLSIDYAKLPVGPTFVVRVVVVVEWFGPRRALLGSREIVPTTYGIGDSGAVLSEGCHTFLS